MTRLFRRRPTSLQLIAAVCWATIATVLTLFIYLLGYWLGNSAGLVLLGPIVIAWGMWEASVAADEDEDAGLGLWLASIAAARDDEVAA